MDVRPANAADDSSLGDLFPHQPAGLVSPLAASPRAMLPVTLLVWVGFVSLRSRRLGALCEARTWNKGRSFVASLLRPLERGRGLGRRRLLENFGVCCADCCLRRSGCPCSSLRRRLVAVLACMFGGKKRLLHLRALRCLIPRFGAVSLCFCLISCRLDGSFVLDGANLPCNSTVLALKNGNASPEIISVQGRKFPPGAIGRFVLMPWHYSRNEAMERRVLFGHF